MHGLDCLPLQILDDLYDGAYFLDKQRRITYWNSAAERLTGYTRQEVVGRCCAANILLHIDETGHSLCQGDCPAALTMVDGQAREAEIFLRHKQGHRLPVLARVSPIRDESGEIVAALELFADNSPRLEERARLKELERQAMLDPLTKLPNRRYLEGRIAGRLAELERNGWPFGVIFIDLDRFKHVNDCHGHDMGDRVLVMVSRAMEMNSRSFDTVGRWGGEEFLAVVPNVDLVTLAKVAERYRVLVRGSSLCEGGAHLSVTVSLGATLARPGESPDSLVGRADRLMYQSKQAGRDCLMLG